jgi:hypothetical protein
MDFVVFISIDDKYPRSTRTGAPIAEPLPKVAVEDMLNVAISSTKANSLVHIGMVIKILRPKELLTDSEFLELSRYNKNLQYVSLFCTKKSYTPFSREMIKKIRFLVVSKTISRILVFSADDISIYFRYTIEEK